MHPMAYSVCYNWPVTCGPTTTKLWLNYWYSGVGRFASGGMKGSQHGNGLLILYGSLRAHSSQWRPNILTYVCRGKTVYNISLMLKEKNGQCDSPYSLVPSVYMCCVSPFSVNMAIQSKNVSAEMMHVWTAWQVGVKMYAISFSLLLSCF